MHIPHIYILFVIVCTRFGAAALNQAITNNKHTPHTFSNTHGQAFSALCINKTWQARVARVLLVTRFFCNDPSSVWHDFIARQLAVRLFARQTAWVACWLVHCPQMLLFAYKIWAFTKVTSRLRRAGHARVAFYYFSLNLVRFFRTALFFFLFITLTLGLPSFALHLPIH